MQGCQVAELISESSSPIIQNNTISVNLVYDICPFPTNQRGGGGISIVGTNNNMGIININENTMYFNQSHVTTYSGNPNCSGMGGAIYSNTNRKLIFRTIVLSKVLLIITVGVFTLLIYHD